MLMNKLRLIKVCLPVALIVLTNVLVLSPREASAQCPIFTGDESFTFGITRFQNPNAQLWFNDGQWWGVFSDMTTGIYSYSFTQAGLVKGPIVDGNVLGSPDVLWDGTNLHVLVWKSLALATFYKYSYDSVTKTYTLLSGFPVSLPLNGASPPTVLEKDSTGKLWATYTSTNGGGSDGKVHVIWSTSADHKVWDTTGNILETGLNPINMEVADIVHFGGNKIGIVWSNYPGKQIAFRYHVDGDPETTWSTKELVDSGNGPSNFPGGSVADDHLSMAAAPDGRIFLAAKDNDNDGTLANAHVGRLWLYIRTAAGIWGQKTIVQPDPSQIPTRPVLALDTTHNVAYVVYHDETLPGRNSTGRNFITHTTMDSPFFDFPCVFNPTPSSNPLGTKQNVTSATGMMFAASTGQTASNELVFRGVDLNFNPVPTVTSLSPSSAITGGAAFTLTVNGTGFVTNSVAQWNGADRPTIVLNSTQLTASITAADISVAGTAAVTVTNPTPGGGISNSQDFPINNPVPTLTSISPTTKTAGDPTFVLTANGTNFLNNSSVRVNGTDRPTTFVNNTQLTAQLTAADVQAAGTVPITVFNFGPGGGTSNAINLTVNNPPPSLTSISSTVKIVGDPAFTLTVNGSGFVSSSVVRFNGSNRTTSFLSSTQLTAQITAADLQNPGTFPITVLNSAPGGGTSNAINLAVNNPLPTLASISPTSKTAGDPAFTLTVNGGSFISSSVVRFNGSDRTTAFVSSTQLTAQITATDVQAAGSFPITVFNPAPGGGSSNAINLVVSASVNPTPTLTSLTPPNITAGAAAFTLTVTGTNFIASSVVQWNGASRTTTVGSSTQLTAQIAAADVATAGSANVTVFNPAPGGGTSNSLTFTINAAGCVGYESDVAPRPNGSNNGTIAISDWVQSGRFSAGLDVPNVGCEFARADSAPRSSLGNGAITVSDWVQAGRYAAGLDPVTPVGGPTAPLSAPQKMRPSIAKVGEVATNRIVRATGDPLNAGQSGLVSIELDSQGDENALGFSVTFNPSQLTFVSATPGSAAGGVTLNVNPQQVAAGRLGIAMAQPAGQAFAAGTRQLVVITFNVAANASGSTVIGFGDQPIPREISDPNVNLLDANYNAVTLSINPVNPASTLQFSSATYQLQESQHVVQLTVMRTGDTSSAVTVNFSTDDSNVFVECGLATGIANQRCDYTATAGMLSFAPGETSKTFSVMITDDAYVEGNETFTVSLSGPAEASNAPSAVVLGTPAQATITIIDDDTVPPSANPVDDTHYFVYQHYIDFLHRLPDPGGLEYWSGLIDQCNGDANCIRNMRIDVSAAFFASAEFQQTGSYIYGVYAGTLGRTLNYGEFSVDRSQVLGGPELDQAKTAFAQAFIQRPEFTSRYPQGISREQFVDAVIQTMTTRSGVDQSALRNQLLGDYDSGGRALVVRHAAEASSFVAPEYNKAFVLMEYFGYLRRDIDPGGYAYWLSVINGAPGNYRGMVCAFLTSTEYQQRFSSVVTRTNQDCAQ